MEKGALLARRVRPAKRPLPATSAVMSRRALEDALASLGIQSGDHLMVHSSWGQIRTLVESPGELIAVLRGVLGAAGTLCMPAYPHLPAGRPKVFDLRRTPSTAGLLSEVFRRMSGVVRSAQLRSVAAAGPLAIEFTREHHLSPYPSGKLSPYAKLAAAGGKVLCLGVGPDSNTMFHCAEDILEPAFPVSVYEDGLTHLRVVVDDVTTLDVPAYIRSARWTYCCDAIRMIPYVQKAIRSHRVNGVEAHMVDAATFLERLIALGQAGVHMYGFRFPPPDEGLLAVREAGHE